MKKLFRMLGTIVLAGALASGSMSALAYDNGTESGNFDIIEPCYVGIDDVYTRMSISGGKATCVGVVTTESKHTVSCTLTLQRKKSGSWIDVQSWSSKGNISQSSSVTSGKTYRAKFHGVVKNSKGTKVDSFTKYTGSKTA